MIFWNFRACGARKCCETLLISLVLWKECFEDYSFKMVWSFCFSLKIEVAKQLFTRSYDRGAANMIFISFHERHITLIQFVKCLFLWISGNEMMWNIPSRSKIQKRFRTFFIIMQHICFVRHNCIWVKKIFSSSPPQAGKKLTFGVCKLWFCKGESRKKIFKKKWYEKIKFVTFAETLKNEVFGAEGAEKNLRSKFW